MIHMRTHDATDGIRGWGDHAFPDETPEGCTDSTIDGTAADIALLCTAGQPIYHLKIVSGAVAVMTAAQKDTSDADVIPPDETAAAAAKAAIQEMADDDFSGTDDEARQALAQGLAHLLKHL